jgi:hypothetical protein
MIFAFSLAQLLIVSRTAAAAALLLHCLLLNGFYIIFNLLFLIFAFWYSPIVECPQNCSSISIPKTFPPCQWFLNFFKFAILNISTFLSPIVDCHQNSSSSSIPFTLPPLQWFLEFFKLITNLNYSPTDSECLPNSFLPISIIIIIISNIFSCGLTFTLMVGNVAQKLKKLKFFSIFENFV